MYDNKYEQCSRIYYLSESLLLKKCGFEPIYTAVWLCDLFLKPSLQGQLLRASTSMFVLNSEAFFRLDFASLTGNTDAFEAHNQRDENIKRIEEDEGAGKVCLSLLQPKLTYASPWHLEDE